MPSSATITAFYSFTPTTANSPSYIRSAEVNNNFSAFRGHFIPIDPNTATAATTRTYDLGSDDYRWRRVYGKVWENIASTTGSMSITASHDVVMMNSTSATITASLFAVANNTSASFTLMNIGTANTVIVDPNGAEQIRTNNGDTATVELVPGESIKFLTDGAKWYMI